MVKARNETEQMNARARHDAHELQLVQPRAEGEENMSSIDCKFTRIEQTNGAPNVLLTTKVICAPS